MDTPIEGTDMNPVFTSAHPPDGGRRRPPRKFQRSMVWVFGVGLFGASLLQAQEPVVIQSPMPVAPPSVSAPVQARKGPLHRAVTHTSEAIHTYVIGDPARFHEPPLGSSINEITALQACRADQHAFTLYRTDFVSGTERLTPTGADRFARMVRRLDGWLGPILIEAVPEQPGLAEQRKASIVSLAQACGTPVWPERLVVGRSAYHGLPGDAAGLNYPIAIQRAARADGSYPLTPIPVNQLVGPTGAGGP
jgi:hypothetical protein